MTNQSLIESLSKHLKENSSSKLEVVIRNLIAEEETATASYLKAAHKVAERAKEHQDKIGLRISKVFEDIANEEKVHIGELQKCLELIGISNKEIEQGKKEAGEIL